MLTLASSRAATVGRLPLSGWAMIVDHVSLLEPISIFVPHLAVSPISDGDSRGVC
jgi:hypothetical protein